MKIFWQATICFAVVFVLVHIAEANREYALIDNACKPTQLVATNIGAGGYSFAPQAGNSGYPGYPRALEPRPSVDTPSPIIYRNNPEAMPIGLMIAVFIILALLVVPTLIEVGYKWLRLRCQNE